MHATSACLSLTAHIARRSCVQWCHRFAQESVCAFVCLWADDRQQTVQSCVKMQHCSFVKVTPPIHFSLVAVPFYLFSSCRASCFAVCAWELTPGIAPLCYPPKVWVYLCVCVCVCLFKTTEPNSPQFFWLPYFSYCKSPNTSRNLDLDNTQFAWEEQYLNKRHSLNRCSHSSASLSPVIEKQVIKDEQNCNKERWRRARIEKHTQRMW